MFRTMRLAAVLLVILSWISALPVTAHAQGGVVVGTLSCNVASGFGFVFGSSRALNCTSEGPAAVMNITSGTSRDSESISATSKAEFWSGPCSHRRTPLRPARSPEPMRGATASATVGVGVGANALVGGFNSSFALQPLSVEANRGLNVAAGIGAMTLTSAP